MYAGVFLALAPATVWAQAAPVAASTAGSETSLEELVVRAQRRDERLQDVPIAVTAISGKGLAENRITDSTDLVRLVPNLQINGAFGSIPKITIRGIGTNDFNLNVQPAVGTYIDDIYIAPPPAQNIALFDLERVEVLRGPQGTLYGKNTTGGAINYYSANPGPEFGMGASATIASYGRFEQEGHINIPLSDAGGVRVAFIHRKDNGHWNNLYAQAPRGDGDFVDSWAGRVKAVFDLSETVRFSGSVYGGHSDGDATHRVPVGTFPGGGDIVGYVDPPGVDDGTGDKLGLDRVRVLSADGRFDVDLGDFKLTSITGAGKVTRRTQQDADYSQNDVINIVTDGDQRYLTQELQLARTWDTFSLIVGAHYFREKQDVGGVLDFFNCVATATCKPKAPIPHFQQVTAYSQKNTSYAAFSQANWKLTEKLNVTGGLRFTHETADYDGASSPNPLYPALFPGWPRYVTSKTWKDLTWKLGVDYKPTEQALLYATVGTGFRAGNWNGGAFQRFEEIRAPVDPEHMTAYEAGFKTQWLEQTLRINGSVFYNKYKDLQVSVFRNASVVQDNAADANIYGAELEVAWRPTRELLINWTAAGLNAKYKDYVTSVGADLSDNTMVNAPKFNTNLSAEYHLALGDDWELIPAADVRYQTKVWYRPENDLGERPYAIANARLTLKSTQNNLSVSVFATNLFDKRVVIDGSKLGTPFFIDTYIYNRPRIVGASVSAAF